MTTPPAPAVDDSWLEERGWRLVDERTGVRFEGPTVRICDHTVVYEDDCLREQVAEATGTDQTWRFFFATTLSFEPSLPPLTGTASVYGTVRSGARDAFVDELRTRGVDGIDRRRTERMRTETGDRVSLTPYRGRLTADDAHLPIGGLLGVWTHDGQFRLAGGGYPDQSLATVVDGAPETNPHEMRDDLVTFVRRTQ